MSRTKPIVMDFDDYCDATAPKLDLLCRLKDRMPNLQVTLFAIPRRCSPAAIRDVKILGDWVALGMHGWRHTLGECWSWTKDEALAKMRLAAAMGIDAGVFRAPQWVLDAETYYAAAELGWAVADHKDFRVLGTGCRVYTYNKPIWNPPYTRVHGHLPNVCRNGIEEAFDQFVFRKDATFVPLTEAAAVDTTQAVAPSTLLMERGRSA